MPKLVKQARPGWLRSLLILFDADLWGPDWLWDWITEGDPKAQLYVFISRSLDREPENWSVNPYGVTNLEDQIGVYTAEGPNGVAVAVDHDEQHYPAPYYRWLLYDAVQVHRKVVAAQEAADRTQRLLA